MQATTSSQEIPFHPLADVFPLMEGQEYRDLVEDIRERGLLDPIVLHEGSILDGRNRYRAAHAAQIAARFEQFAGDDAVAFVISKNLRRRHLGDAQRSMAAAKLAKLSPGRPQINSADRQNYLVAPAPSAAPTMTRKEAATLLNVSERSVNRAAAVLAHGVPELVHEVERGEIALVPAEEVSRLAPERQRQLIVEKFTGDNEYNTPAHIIQAARAVLGEIDLDPASNASAQETICAAKFATKETDGLAIEWHGRIWLNPPYSADLIGKFIEKLLSELAAGRTTAALLLVDNRTDTQWFHAAMAGADRLCLTKGRVRFINRDGEMSSPLNGSAILYFGPRPDLFAEQFGPLGMVLRRA